MKHYAIAYASTHSGETHIGFARAASEAEALNIWLVSINFTDEGVTGFEDCTTLGDIEARACDCDLYITVAEVPE